MQSLEQKLDERKSSLYNRIYNTIKHRALPYILTTTIGLGYLGLSPAKAEDKPEHSLNQTRIAYSGADRYGRAEIYTINPDGSDNKKLTNLGLCDHPSWSPDGKMIAFRAVPNGRIPLREGIWNIYSINSDGTNLRKLTNSSDLHCSSPSWSPDGKKIAFDSDRDGNYDIYVLNIDGTRPTKLTRNPARDEWPAWSPDGESIVFLSDRTKSQQFYPQKLYPQQLYMMDTNGKNLRKLTYVDTNIGLPCWSSDGKKIAIPLNEGHSYHNPGTYVMYILNIETSKLERTSYNCSDEGSGDYSWSSDGKKFVFTKFVHTKNVDDAIWELYTINIDGTDKKRITYTKDLDEFKPAWSPSLK